MVRISAQSRSTMRADARPGPLGRRSGGPDLQGAEGSKQFGRGLAPRRRDGGRGVAPFRVAGRAELLVRRGSGRPRAAPVVRFDGQLDGRPRDQSTAVLRPRVAVGARVRDRRSRAAVVVGAHRNRRDPGRLPVRPRARLAPRRLGRCRIRGAQPVHDLVLARGQGVHAAGRSVRPLGPVFREGVARPLGKEPRVVGGVLRARGADPFLRGLPRRSRGRVAAVRDPQPSDRVRSGCSGSRADGAAPASGLAGREFAPGLHYRHEVEHEDPTGAGRVRTRQSLREPGRALRAAWSGGTDRGRDRPAGGRVRLERASRRGRGRCARGSGAAASACPRPPWGGLLHSARADARVDSPGGCGRCRVCGAPSPGGRHDARRDPAGELRLRAGEDHRQPAVSAPGLARRGQGARHHERHARDRRVRRVARH